eukprot:m51a1_g3171 hypothetical protein (690) ;mRNA; f:391048-396395
MAEEPGQGEEDMQGLLRVCGVGASDLALDPADAPDGAVAHAPDAVDYSGLDDSDLGSLVEEQRAPSPRAAVLLQHAAGPLPLSGARSRPAGAGYAAPATCRWPETYPARPALPAGADSALALAPWEELVRYELPSGARAAAEARECEGAWVQRSRERMALPASAPAVSAPFGNAELEAGEWAEAVNYERPGTAVGATAVVYDLDDPAMLFGTGPMEPRSGLQRTDPPPRDDELSAGVWDASIDACYPQPARSLKLRQRVGPLAIRHALPAVKLSVFLTHLTPSDLREFHRPRRAFGPRDTLDVCYCDEAQLAHAGRAAQPPRSKKELSGASGRLFVVEYREENPLVVQGIGMGSRLRSYYRRAEADEPPPPRDPKCGGELVVLDRQDVSPFGDLGDVRPRTQLQSLENNLFKAPAVRHSVAENEFLLVRARDGRWYVREVEAAFVAGQIFPQQAVPSPSARTTASYMRERLRHYALRMFGKREVLRTAALQGAFPSLSGNSIRKQLRAMAEFRRGGQEEGWVMAQPAADGVSLGTSVTPEMVCLHEAMLRGLYLLGEAGVERFTGVASLLMARGCLVDPALREKSKRIEEELVLAPWYLSANYRGHMQGKERLQLTGGDEGFDFRRARRKRGAAKPASRAPRIMGTSADLRTLSLEQAQGILKARGYSDKDLQDVPRQKEGQRAGGEAA